MRKHPLAIAALAVALAACGTEDEGPDIILGEPELEDPVAYFGLQPCTCYEFVDESGMAPNLGVAVEAVSSEFLGNKDGTEEYALVYNIGGNGLRTYVFRPTDPDLLLRQVRIDPPLGPIWNIAEPFAPYLRYPVEPREQPVEAEFQMSEMVEGASQDPVDVTFRANYLPEEQTFTYSTDNGATTAESEEATRVLYRFNNVGFDEGVKWFIPEVGLVRAEVTVPGAGRTTYVLRNKRQLGGTCPSNDLGTSVGDLCGSGLTND